jgi:hypothetical protein
MIIVLSVAFSGKESRYNDDNSAPLQLEHQSDVLTLAVRMKMAVLFDRPE